jgi:hypothetical protein
VDFPLGHEKNARAGEKYFFSPARADFLRGIGLSGSSAAECAGAFGVRTPYSSADPSSVVPSASGRGMTMADWHAGHFTFLPAALSGTFNLPSHSGHLMTMSAPIPNLESIPFSRADFYNFLPQVVVHFQRRPHFRGGARN